MMGRETDGQRQDAAAAEDMPLAFRSAGDLARLIREGTLSAVELADYFIARIERYDGSLNAVVVKDFDRAIEAARAADSALSAGRTLGPLHGVPMTVKESHDVAGLVTCWGDPAFAGAVADSDSVMVSRLKAAGAIILGKTNVPIHLADFQSFNAVYGQTNNPWDVSRGPGGSSGGAAAAVAAGLTGLECGSDIGGSIRNPAHYCGVFGHKPTWGIVPSRGHNPPGTPHVAQDVDLAVLGPLARTAEDLAMTLDIIAGPDVLHAPGWRLDLPQPEIADLTGVRVALWPDDHQAPVETEIADRVVAVGDRLAELGAIVSDTARPDLDPAEARRTYGELLMPIISGPGHTESHQEWMAADAWRGVFRHKWQAFFEDWDIVLCPISATAAFPHDTSPLNGRSLVVNGKEVDFWQQLFWASLATMPLLPSTVFPTGLSQSGLPIGLQAIGAAFNDRLTIRIAGLISRELGGFRPPAGFSD